MTSASDIGYLSGGQIQQQQRPTKVKATVATIPVGGDLRPQQQQIQVVQQQQQKTQNGESKTILSIM